MKKFFAVVLLMALCAGCACAEGEAHRKLVQGVLTHVGMSIEEYTQFDNEATANNVWDIYFNVDPVYSSYGSVIIDVVVPFDSITDMLMALDAGRIDMMEFPEHVARYFFRQNGNTAKYVPYYYVSGVKYYLSMGFNEGSKWLEPFNSAIKAMNDDDTLLLLKAKYIGGVKEKEPVTFEKFPDAETVRIAVTGDMPPIDYVAEDGTPSGFNTAMLAEIGRRLKVNVELLNVNAGARAAALASGRADGVFWFWYDTTTNVLRDVPAGVALTEPYYTWDTWLQIGKRISK